MQTIIVLLNPGKLENRDMDLCYCIPDRLKKVSDNAIQDNGYDFIDTEDGTPGPLMAVWLKTESAGESWPIVKKVFQEEKFKGNDLSASAEIYISEEDSAALEKCRLVFPG